MQVIVKDTLLLVFFEVILLKIRIYAKLFHL